MGNNESSIPTNIPYVTEGHIARAIQDTDSMTYYVTKIYDRSTKQIYRAARMNEHLNALKELKTSIDLSFRHRSFRKLEELYENIEMLTMEYRAKVLVPIDGNEYDTSEIIKDFLRPLQEIYNEFLEKFKNFKESYDFILEEYKQTIGEEIPRYVHVKPHQEDQPTVTFQEAMTDTVSKNPCRSRGMKRYPSFNRYYNQRAVELAGGRIAFQRRAQRRRDDFNQGVAQRRDEAVAKARGLELAKDRNDLKREASNLLDIEMITHGIPEYKKEIIKNRLYEEIDRLSEERQRQRLENEDERSEEVIQEILRSIRARPNNVRDRCEATAAAAAASAAAAAIEHERFFLNPKIDMIRQRLSNLIMNPSSLNFAEDAVDIIDDVCGGQVDREIISSIITQAQRNRWPLDTLMINLSRTIGEECV